MTSATSNTHVVVNIQDKKETKHNIFTGCFGGRRVKNIPQDNDLHVTDAFRKEFQAKPKDGSTELIRTRPIRFNKDTGKMEVAYNGGSGLEWKPLQ